MRKLVGGLGRGVAADAAHAGGARAGRPAAVPPGGPRAAGAVGDGVAGDAEPGGNDYREAVVVLDARNGGAGDLGEGDGAAGLPERLVAGQDEEVPKPRSARRGPCRHDWDKVSNWNVYAQSGSGYYGIPQARPGDIMADAGPDWRTDAATQIKWGLGYIKETYGTPCGAWQYAESNGTY